MTSRIPDPEPPGLPLWLIRAAARSAPATVADRLEEEWHADLMTLASPFTRLRFALGCCWAARMIAGDYLAEAAAVAAPGTGTGRALARPGEDTGLLRRHSLAVVAVVGFHVALVYALMMGLGGEATRPALASFPVDVIADTQAAATPR